MYQFKNWKLICEEKDREIARLKEELERVKRVERLTTRNIDGSVGINSFRYYNYDDFQKLAKKLAYYEDLEEQGLLLKLPCKVGDRTYQVVTKHERVKRGGCTCCTTACGSNCNCDYFTEDGTCTNLTGNSKYQIISRGFKLEDFYEFGKTIFLTKAEAEKALEEMED